MNHNSFSQTALSIAMISSSFLTGMTGASARIDSTATPRSSGKPPTPIEMIVGQPHTGGQLPFFMQAPATPHIREFFLKSENLPIENLDRLLPKIDPEAPVAVIIDNFNIEDINRYFPFKGSTLTAHNISHGETVRAAFLSQISESTKMNVIYVDDGSGALPLEEILERLSKSSLPIDVINISQSNGHFSVDDLQKAGITPENIRSNDKDIVESLPHDGLYGKYKSPKDAFDKWINPMQEMHKKNGTHFFLSAGNNGVGFINANKDPFITTVGGDPNAHGTPFAEMNTEFGFSTPKQNAFPPAPLDQAEIYNKITSKYHGKPVESLIATRSEIEKLMQLLSTAAEKSEKFEDTSDIDKEIRAITQGSKVFSLRDLEESGYLSQQDAQAIKRHNPEATLVANNVPALVSIMDASYDFRPEESAVFLTIDSSGKLQSFPAEAQPDAQILLGTSHNAPQAAGAFAKNLYEQRTMMILQGLYRGNM